MADFETVQQADASARAKMRDGTYTIAFGGTKKTNSAVPVMHVLNPVTASDGGDWSEVTTVPE
jgi:hypothetical protein